MNTTKGIDKQALEELIFGAYRLNKINRDMRMLKTCMIHSCGSGAYFLRPLQQLQQHMTLELDEVYQHSRGGPP